MRFVKAHGLGNDFLFAPPGAGPDPAAAGELARRVCDRHTGIGADGLIFLGVEKAAPAEARFRIFNADGSEAELSGNGLRCAAAFLAWCGSVKSPRILFHTAVGDRPAEVLSSRGSAFEVRIGLGVPRVSAKDIPFDDGQTLDRVADYPLFVVKRTFPVTCVSMGNPHCSLFFDELPARNEWRTIGAGIETHPFFRSGPTSSSSASLTARRSRSFSGNEASARPWLQARARRRPPLRPFLRGSWTGRSRSRPPSAA